MENFKLTIGENEANQRCDTFLRKYLKNAALGDIYKMLRKKIIRVNGKKSQINYRLKIGDIIEFRLHQDTLEKLIQKKTISGIAPVLDIVYEDKNILLVNKASGVIVHPDKKNRGNTLSEMVVRYLYDKGEYNPDIESTFRPAGVNRLDLNTSGLVLFAKNFPSLQLLNSIFRNFLVHKYYLTLVKGKLKGKGELKGYLVKDSKTNKVQIHPKPVLNSREVFTRYESINSYEDSTLLKVELITGRPHQIRAHFKNIGHPLAGDPKYGDTRWNNILKNKFNLKRQFLHASSLEFNKINEPLSYLSGKTFEAPLPDELKKVIY